MATEKNIPDVQKFLNDPEFQGDRGIIFACVDARLKQIAEEQAKNNPPKDERTFLQRLFDGPEKK